MTLAAAAAATGAMALMLSAQLAKYLPHVDLVRAGQIQIVHAMATISCATFINAGAIQARRAPPMFLVGIVCLIFSSALSEEWAATAILLGQISRLAFAAGWALLIVSAKDIGKIAK